MSNAIAPSVTPPSPFEWPETIRTLTGITNAAEAQVTCPNHGFTSADQGITSVMFLQVEGMLPINHTPGRIQTVIDSNNFTVNINSTQFPAYSSAGVISIITGQPPSEQISFQFVNTPLYNIATTY